MKVYKLEVMVIDFDELGEDGIKIEFENARYANRCMYPRIKKIESRDIGEWDDEHPLNDRVACQAEYERLFAEPQK